jgi:CRISPR system Cascade subunit CasD
MGKGSRFERRRCLSANAPHLGPRRWLILRLEAPLLSFGAVAIDHRGVIWDFPALSMLTGLFANALGWQRTQAAQHQALEDRIIFAARREREPYTGTLRDTQNAKLGKNDKGWTTRGMPEGRDGASYNAPHRRQRDYHPDALITVAVTLRVSPTDVPGAAPSIDDLAAALDRPARPLFIGRKPCLPSSPLRLCFIEADTAYEAISALPRQDGNGPPQLRAQWPTGEGPTTGPGIERTTSIADRRNWISGLHGGTRQVVEGRVTPPAAATLPAKDVA